jgi:hypothetical protein
LSDFIDNPQDIFTFLWMFSLEKSELELIAVKGAAARFIRNSLAKEMKN